MRFAPLSDRFYITIPGYGPGAAAAELLWSDLRHTLTTHATEEAA